MVTKLQACADAGMTYTEAARQIGLGLNRDKVSGLATRNAIVFGAGVSATPVFKPLRFTIVDDKPAFGPIHAREVERGDSRCRWPLWPDRIYKGPPSAFRNFAGAPSLEEMEFCGQRTEDGAVYCISCRAKACEPSISRTPAGQGRKVNSDGRRAGWHYGT